eukprot:COSAG02_NODE_1219_length_13812_cov_108.713629_9_plen_196_part_00
MKTAGQKVQRGPTLALSGSGSSSSAASALYPSPPEAKIPSSSSSSQTVSVSASSGGFSSSSSPPFFFFGIVYGPLPAGNATSPAGLLEPRPAAVSSAATSYQATSRPIATSCTSSNTLWDNYTKATPSKVTSFRNGPALPATTGQFRAYFFNGTFQRKTNGARPLSGFHTPRHLNTIVYTVVIDKTVNYGGLWGG